MIKKTLQQKIQESRNLHKIDDILCKASYNLIMLFREDTKDKLKESEELHEYSHSEGLRPNIILTINTRKFPQVRVVDFSYKN